MTSRRIVQTFVNGFCIKLLYGLILLSFVFTGKEISAENTFDEISDNASHYPIQLYQNQDYYRSISEILKLKFEKEDYNQELDLYLLKNYYQLNNQYQLQRSAEKLLKEKHDLKNWSHDKETKQLLSLSFLKSGKEDLAKATWDKCCLDDGFAPFPMSANIPGQVDPDRAKLFSTIVPGSGLLLSGSYSKAAVSFLLNSIFIYGCFHYASQDQPGIAGLLLFFEMGWYFGGRNAAHEAAVNYNETLILRHQQQWIDSNLKPILFNHDEKEEYPKIK